MFYVNVLMKPAGLNSNVLYGEYWKKIVNTDRQYNIFVRRDYEKELYLS